ncbi:hypothetical protein SAMN06272789_6797 [Streptomyces sp. 1331.2]|nr:hypothetical protein SAMN06272789_6797 [Streptomyces sp. 1331.2]
MTDTSPQAVADSASAVRPPLPGPRPGGRGAAERVPEAYAPRISRIRSAVAAGEFALAGRLAAELHQRIAAARGDLHPEALRAQEVHAHVAALGGDFVQAADIYTAAAAGWASRGAAAERWTASRNAAACRQRAASTVRSRSDWLLWTGVSGRRAVIASVLVAALFSAATSSSPPTRLAAAQRPAADGRPVAPDPAPTAPSTPSPTVAAPRELPPAASVSGPTAELEPTAQPTTSADEPAGYRVRPGNARPGGRTPGPSAAPRQERTAPDPRPVPGPAPDTAAGSGTDPCAAARQFGRLPDSLLALCHRAAGVAGRRSAPPAARSGRSGQDS